MPGIPLQDVWDDIPPASGKEDLGYPTQKPEALLERIVRVASNEGELVLDPFCGCGTAVAAAERLKRRWIGIDITYRVIHIAEVDRNGVNVGVRHDSKRQSIANDWSHRGGRRPVQRAGAGSEEKEQILLRPWHKGGIPLIERGCHPAVDHCAGIRLRNSFAAQRVARRMAAATIAECFSQISSAIPIRALGGVALEASASEEKNFPAFLESAGTQWEGNRVRRHACADRLARH
ncbi:MAG: site-specific DNA-methyltransferase [Bryobacteraceae bacterium]